MAHDTAATKCGLTCMMLSWYVWHANDISATPLHVLLPSAYVVYVCMYVCMVCVYGMCVCMYAMYGMCCYVCCVCYVCLYECRCVHAHAHAHVMCPVGTIAISYWHAENTLINCQFERGHYAAPRPVKTAATTSALNTTPTTDSTSTSTPSKQ